MIHTVWVIPLPSVTNQEEQFLKFKPTTNLQKAKHDHVFNSQNTWHNLFDVIDVHMMPLKFQYSSNNKNKYQITNSFLWVSHIAIFHRDSEQIKYRTFLGSVIEIENESLAPILVAYLYFILPQILKIIFEILIIFHNLRRAVGCVLPIVIELNSEQLMIGRTHLNL